MLPVYFPIAVTTGTTVTKTTDKKRNTNPIVVHYDNSVNYNSVVGTSGVKFNLSSSMALDINVGLDNIGITGYYKDKRGIQGIGVKVNIMDMKVGFEKSFTIEWDIDESNTIFTNVSINVAGVAMAYALVNGYAPAVQR